jgi:hypothetical protein
MTARELFGGMVLVGLAVAALLSIFPVWRSATVSPDSIKRRTYWTGTTVAVVCSFLAAWPEWLLGLVIAMTMALAMLAIAIRYTSHVKIRGRIYGLPGNRGPDRPPARAPQD